MFESIFWIATLFVIYTFIGYPLLIQLLAKQRQSPLQYSDRTPPSEWPHIAFIVPIHNEAAFVAKKIASIKAIDYPKEAVSIIFVSDGSEDASNELIAADPEVTLIHYHPRAGKPTALNRGVEAASADILIMTDARQSIEPSAIKRLVTRLQDDTIGAVSGELVFIDSTTETGAQVGLYWRYEKWIRDAESRFASVAGVTGALYAIRRTDFKPLYPEAILDDFEIPISILRTGKRVVFETGAEVYDSPQEDAQQEKIRKIRTLTGNFQAFQRNRWLFSPTENAIFWQFLSHKVFRLAIPHMLLLILISSMFAQGWLYKLALVLQLLFYGIGLSHYYLPNRYAAPLQQSKLGSFVKVFIELNWASVLALKNYLDQNIDIKWQKT